MGVENYTSKKCDRSYKLRKERTSIPTSKIVIRRLPPSFTKEEFIEAVAPLPPHNYFSFVPADRDLGPHAFSRVYINLNDVEEIFTFRDKFDGYVFVDQKGNEYPAIVEYAPFSKVPKSNSQLKKDARCGTIQEDPDYLAFLESLQNPEPVNVPLMETLLEEIESKEKELKANNGILKIKTPLLEYVEQRGLDRLRGIDRKRRKELDRRRAREEERRKRKEAREFRKRDEFSIKDERESRVRKNEDERPKRKDEEKVKYSNTRERERAQIKTGNEIIFNKGRDENDGKSHLLNDKKRLQLKHSKEIGRDLVKDGSRSKRYSVGRRKDEKERRKYDPLIKEEFEIFESSSDKDVSILKSPIKKRERNINIKETNKAKISTDDVCSQKEKPIDKSADAPDELPIAEKIDNSQGEPIMENEDSNLRELAVSPLIDSVSSKSEDFEDSNAEKVGDESASVRRERKVVKKIRNKDRPAMQLYRPGQSRLSARQKNSKDENLSSSSSSSPVMDEDIAEESERQN